MLWSILRDGEPFDLGGRSLKLYLKNMYERREVTDFSVEGNQIRWTFFGKDQKNTGKYSLILVANEGDEGMITTDACDFVRLVSCSCKVQNGEDACNVQTEAIELASTLEYVAGGSSIEVDTELNEDSLNPVANAAVATAIDGIEGKIPQLVTIAPLFDAEAIKAAVEKYDLTNKLGQPFPCFIKENSYDEFKPATLVVEQFKNLESEGYKLTFVFLGLTSRFPHKSSLGELDDPEGLYSPNCEMTSGESIAFLLQPSGFVIPLGKGKANLNTSYTIKTVTHHEIQKAIKEGIVIEFNEPTLVEAVLNYSPIVLRIDSGSDTGSIVVAAWHENTDHPRVFFYYYWENSMIAVSYDIDGNVLSAREYPMGGSAESSVFEAVKNTTTLTEIIDAHNKGKEVICHDGGNCYRLNFINSNFAYFVATYSAYLKVLVCNASGWNATQSSTFHKLETLADNKVKITIADKSAEVATPQYVENLLGTIINGDY